MSFAFRSLLAAVVVSLGFVLLAEKGRLFRAHHLMGPEQAAMGAVRAERAGLH